MPDQRSRLELLDELRGVVRAHAAATVAYHLSIAVVLGLNATAYKALGVLDRLGPMRAGDIAQQTGLTAASVTNLIDRMAAKGYVRREPDPADGRRVVLRAVVDTPELTDIFSSALKSLEQQWDRYSYGELVVILDFLAADAQRLDGEAEALSKTAMR
jgi:predicted transcriptional regulator